jgi:hypothetical protein
MDKHTRTSNNLLYVNIAILIDWSVGLGRMCRLIKSQHKLSEFEPHLFVCLTLWKKSIGAAAMNDRTRYDTEYIELVWRGQLFLFAYKGCYY